ncbi:MAG: hypothetical protein WB930_00130 [Syntrophobacteraceae bacterium]
MARIIIPAHSDHIFWLANNMRAPDREEVAAAVGMGPYRALSDSLQRSAAAWTGMVNDEPVCMFGVTPVDILGGIGSPWLLGAEDLPKYAITFLKANKGYVLKMLGLFPYLQNYVDVRNEMSVKWLKWLGFKFDPEPVPYGIWGLRFYRFHMRRWDRLPDSPLQGGGREKQIGGKI